MNYELLIMIGAGFIMLAFIIYYETLISKAKSPESRKLINYYELENAPSTFVTIGLLGTCAGIFLGLLNFNTDAGQIKSSVKDLLSGLRFAFLVTIIGLIFSLFYKQRVNRILNIYGDIQPPASPELEEMQKSNMLLADLSRGISTLNRAFSDDLISKIQESNKKLADNLSKFGENLATSNHDALIEALQEVCEDLNSGFRDTLGLLVKQNFSELTNSIESLNNWQKENKAYIENFAERYEKIVQHTNDINTNLEKIVNTNANLLSQNSSLYDIVNALNSVMVKDEKFVQITSNLNEASATIKSSVIEFNSELQTTRTQLQAIANLRVNIELLIAKLAELKHIDAEEERLYMTGISQTMASMDEMFKRHYEAIPRLIDQNLKAVANG
ncbi:MotA/TolQ/ExbB proton channel family protein [Marnyiella aurantia]|uniref:MotA/TolQ/ExbB proton channel family protein n=1 Tax=Marnyiella aurantia TaxID=2758037 RepID=A0A7D7LQE1_9FLAO|nr:MotA/TolQ/ExbB proton channel family protein [Marnyiella aurantia]MBA5245843.1 MotA/TolQ/ExbB proton channel family protein [Marnyiella aurantia]QMS98756.1 MotA/TolQ/ExbB proton channel family protein [Marnyiella aurantia]